MWKTRVGHCIYRSAGMEVLQNPLFRWLQFESKAIQTLLNRHFPHRPELSYIKSLILAVQLQPTSCCMLGLGGGGTAHTLSPLLGANKLTIVENSAEVIEIASRFFMIDQLNNHSIIQQDASVFVHEYPDQFQHLLVDIFDAHAFPAHCNNEQFFANCKRLLKPNGILAVNLANRHEQWPIFQLIQAQFLRSTLALPILDSPNMIILAQNSDSIIPFINRLKCKALTWNSKWGYVAKIK